MTWKTILLDQLLYKPIIQGKVCAITIPYYPQGLKIGVGEKLNLIFQDNEKTNIVKVKLNSVNIIQYKNITDELAQEAGFKTSNLLQYNLQETFKDYISKESYFLHLKFSHVGIVNEKSSIDVIGLRDKIMDGLSDMHHIMEC